MANHHNEEHEKIAAALGVKLDADGFPPGMRETAERAITDIFCPNGEQLRIPLTGGAMDFCPVCGERAPASGFKIAWDYSERNGPSAPLVISHPEKSRTCVTSLFMSDKQRAIRMVAGPEMGERLARKVAAVIYVTYRDKARNIVERAMEGLGGA